MHNTIKRSPLSLTGPGKEQKGLLREEEWTLAVMETARN